LIYFNILWLILSWNVVIPMGNLLCQSTGPAYDDDKPTREYHPVANRRLLDLIFERGIVIDPETGQEIRIKDITDKKRDLSLTVRCHGYHSFKITENINRGILYDLELRKVKEELEKYDDLIDAKWDIKFSQSKYDPPNNRFIKETICLHGAELTIPMSYIPTFRMIMD